MITHERLKELLNYDASTGVFIWRVSRKGRFVRIGAKAGCLDKRGYLTICLDGRRYFASRLAWLYEKCVWPTGEIDHKNGVHADNRFTNLRDVTRTENQQNLRRACATSKTGVLGVSVHQGRYRATIGHAGKRIHIGSFDTKEAAHAAYIEVKRELHEGCTI